MPKFWKQTVIVLITVLSLVGLAFGQATLLPNAKQQFLDNNGNPLSSGTVDFYVPSTSTRKSTWQDSAKGVLNTNPVTLDAAGRATIYGDGSYRQVVKSQGGGTTIWDAVTTSTGSGGVTPAPTVGDGLAVGSIMAWASPVLPPNYLYADGTAVSRVTYSDLLAATTITQNTTCVSGSPVLAGLTDTTNIKLTAVVETTCAPPGVTVTAKTGSSITLSSNATATAAVPVTVFPNGNGNGSTTFNLPNAMGRVLVGRNNMNGTASAVMSTTYYLADPNGLGSAGGLQSHVLTIAEMAQHNHTFVGDPHDHTFTYTTLATDSGSGGATNYRLAGVGASSQTTTSTVVAGSIANTGGNAPHSIVQPSLTINYIVKVAPDASAAVVSGVASLGGMVGVINCGANLSCVAGTISWVAPAPSPINFVYASDYGVVCNNIADDTPAAQAAINAAAGRPIFFPAGTCIITSTLSYTTTSANSFTQGLQIEGMGREKTIFDNRVAGGPLIAVDTSADFKFQSGVRFSNFKIITTTRPANSGGIRIHKAVYSKIQNVQITGLDGYGVYIPLTGGGVASGDADGSFEFEMDNIRMDNISGWCFDSLPDGGFTENSNIKVINSTFQGCGTYSSASPPTSGAMRWRGLIGSIINSGFTVNYNVALLTVGTATGSNLNIQDTAFENTIGLGAQIQISSGFQLIKMQNSECLNNTLFHAGGCFTVNSPTANVSNVSIENMKIRASAALMGTIAAPVISANGNLVIASGTGGTIPLLLGDNLTAIVNKINAVVGPAGTNEVTASASGTQLLLTPTQPFSINATSSAAVLSSVGMLAGQGSNYTAFSASGVYAPTFIRSKNTYWQTFGEVGQVRFSGFQFDPMQGQAKFNVTGVGTARIIPVGYGAVIPLKLCDLCEWVPYQVPNAGITAAGLTGLSNNTVYYFYLYNTAAVNAALTGAIEVSAAVPILDTVSGYFVKTLDSSRTYIGQATTDGSGQITTNGSDISWYGVTPASIPISLTSQVTGTLPVANGGTGATSLTAFGVVYGNGTSAVGTANGTVGNSSQALISQGDALAPVYAILSAAGGGTGLANTATANRYLKANGTQFATSLGPASGTGTCSTGAVVTGNNSDSAPTCSAVKGAFRANKNAVDQTGLVSATPTKITFTTEAVDTGSYYDTTTSVYTPPAGPISIAAGLVYNTDVVLNSAVLCMIYKNGTEIARGNYRTVVVNVGTAYCSVHDEANGTDTYEIYGQVQAAGTGTVSGTLINTYFTGRN